MPDGRTLLLEDLLRDADGDGRSDGEWYSVDPVDDTCTLITGLVAMGGRVNASPDGNWYTWATGGSIHRMAVGSASSTNWANGAIAIWCPAWNNDLD